MPEPLLDDLAQDAPLPSPGFADAVIAAGRRRVRRVRAAVGAAAGVVVIALAVPVAVQLGRTDSAAPPATANASSPAPLDRTPARPAASGAVAPVEVEVTAALIGHVDSASGASVRAIDVGDEFCADADQPSSTACSGARPITPAMQQQILTRIDTRHPIRFVRTPPRVPLGSSGPGGAVLFLTLGPAEVTGSRARQFVRTWCGFNCLRGDGYVLTRRSGRWQVTGSFGGYLS